MPEPAQQAPVANPPEQAQAQGQTPAPASGQLNPADLQGEQTETGGILFFSTFIY